jgi:hypothetical protein
MQLEGLGKLKNSSDLMGNGNRDLPACGITPQPKPLLRAPNEVEITGRTVWNGMASRCIGLHRL